MKQETFPSRLAVILAGLGMCVGTGNLWRFPRIAAQNGGAAFLIPWLIFLVIWSLPIMIAEFGIGRGARRGPVGAFATLFGARYAWMGGFVAVTSIMIMFYYAVVTGWTLKFFVAAATGDLDGVDSAAYWEAYSGSVWQPILFHVVAVVAGSVIVARGLTGGIVRANSILIPALFVLLLLAVARAVTLPGAERGLAFLFSPDLSALRNYRTWLEALTQSAWSTGAGWGLILAYAVYVKREEDVVVSATAIGFGNNVASLFGRDGSATDGFRTVVDRGGTRGDGIWEPGIDVHLDPRAVQPSAGWDLLPGGLLSGTVLRGSVIADFYDRAGDTNLDGRRVTTTYRGASCGWDGHRLWHPISGQPGDSQQSGLGLGTGVDD